MNDQELLDYCTEHFSYNPNTGEIIKIKSDNPKRVSFIGKVLGGVNRDGYMRLGIKGKKVTNHRVAFLMSYGYLPEFVDHVNKDKTDNRLYNLRACTRSQNMCNTFLRSDNTSGYKGVTYRKKFNKWTVEIYRLCKYQYLGAFVCKHEAARVYNTAARMYHGEFAYTNEVPIA